MTDHQKTEKTVAELAAEWGVSARTMRRWRSSGLPIEDAQQLAQFIIEMPGASQAAKAKAYDVLGASESCLSSAKSPVRGISNKLAESMSGGENLESLRAYYWSKLSVAAQAHDQAAIRFWDERYRAAEKQLRDQEMHAKRLGLDRGEMIAREDVEQLLRAFASAGCASVGIFLSRVSEDLANLDFAEEIYAYLQPEMLHDRLFQPLEKAIKAQGPPHLPEWFVRAALGLVDEYLEPDEPDETAGS